MATPDTSVLYLHCRVYYALHSTTPPNVLRVARCAGQDVYVDTNVEALSTRLAEAINQAVGKAWVTPDEVREALVVRESAFVVLGDDSPSAPIIHVMRTSKGQVVLTPVDQLTNDPWPTLVRVLRRFLSAQLIEELDT